MKKRLLLLTTVMLIAILAFAGCKKAGDQGDGSADDTSLYSDGLYVADGVTFNLLFADEADIDSDLIEAISMATFKNPGISYGESEKKPNEIVFGRVDRQVSVDGYRHLGRLKIESSHYQPYVVYSDGQSLAFCYDGYVLDNKYVREYIFDWFIENYINGGPRKIEAGVLLSGTLNAVEYQVAKDAKYIEECWQKVYNEAGGGKLGEETVTALKSFYELYDDSMVEWLADLYDPDTGGFYYSNSGRNSEGFLPDLESTSQALIFLTGSGMITSLKDSIPEDMQKKLVAFAKSRQDPNGYFYHPQWEKTAIDNNLTRKGRDLGHGESILSAFGASPTYRTPTGIPGDGVVVELTMPPENNLLAPISTPLVKAVSKVTGVSNVSSPHLESLDTLREYLKTLDINGDSYGVGSEIAAQAKQIRARDQELNNGGAMTKLVVDWMNQHCYPTTGTWKNVSDYEGVNGLLKLVDAYNNLRVPLPYPAAAVRSAVNAITSDEAALTVCFPYNTWVATGYIFDNVKNYGTNADALINEIRAELRGNITEAINYTRQKVFQFKKADGSFSYQIGETAANSEGMPVALPHTDEGDVNASFICICGISNAIFKDLGYSYVPQYTESDFMRFICRLADQGSIIKSEYPTIVREATFDGENSGGPSGEITLKSGWNTSSGYVTVVNDPRDGREGNVLLMNSPNNGANCVDLDIHRSSNANASRYFFEGEFCFEFPEEAYAYWSSDEYDPNVHDPYLGYIAQLNMGGVKYNLYMLGFDVSRDGSIRIFESSSSNGKGADNDLGFTAKVGEWFKIKIEYFVGNHDEVRIKVYFNDKLYYVSDNYYSPYADKYFGNDETQETYVGTFINVMSYCYGKVYFDNLITYKDREAYKVERDSNIYYNVDAYTDKEKVYDFDDGALPPELTLSEGNTVMTVEENRGSNALKIIGGQTGSARIPLNIKDLHSTALSFEADITYTTANTGSSLMLYATEKNADEKVVCYILKVEESGSDKFAVLYEAPTGNAGARIGEIKLPVGETHNLRLDYYQKEAKVLIYVDDVLLAVSESLCANAHKFTPNNFNIESVSGAFATIYVDNLLVTKYAKNYAIESAPPVKSQTHDFDYGVAENAVVSGSAVASDGVLKMTHGQTPASIIVPVNVRDTIASTVIFEADILVNKSDVVGSSYIIEIKNAAGNTVLSYKLYEGAEGLYLFEMTGSNTCEARLATIPYDEITTLRIEYYRNRSDIQVYVGGKYVSESGVLYDPEVTDTAPATLTLRTASGSTALTVDNLVAEAYNKTYKNLGLVDAGDSNETGTIDFEKAVTSDLPTRVINEVVSPGGKLRIASAKKGEAISKVLSFESNAGGGDIIYLQAADVPEGYKTVVFEADFLVNYDNLLGGAPFQLYLCDDSGKMAYMVQTTCVSNRINLQAITGAGDAEVPGRISGTIRTTSVKEGEWMNLRLEYYVMSDGTARIITYVNDKLIEDTNLYYMKSSKLDNLARTEITRFRIQSYGSTDATMLIDNVSFTYSNTAYTTPVIPEPDPPTTGEILEDKGIVVLPVKGGANGIVTLIHDDGSASTGKILDTLLKKYGLVADVAMVVSNVYDLTTGAPKFARLEWQNLIDTGRWKIINHSMTHGFWGTEANGSVTIDEEMIKEEVITSGEILRELFPGQKVLTFAYPGHQGMVDKYGESVYDAVRKVVKANYIAGRNYSKTSQTFYDWEWDFMPAESIGVGYLQTTLNTIDAAAEGKIATVFVHNVVTDEDYENRNLSQYGNSYTPISHMTSVMEKIAEHTESGAVWNTHYEDAVLYLREAEAANVTLKDNGSSLTVNLTHTLDSTIYNYALTVRVLVDASWRAVKIVQGTETTYAYVKTENGLTFADLDIVPNAGNVTVTPIKPENIPTGDKPGVGWDDEIEVDSDILDFDNDGGNGTIDNSSWT